MRTTSIAATATATALAAVTAGVGLLVTAPGAASADATKSSAYGAQVTAGGQVVLPPTPKVESTDGSEKTVTGGAITADQTEPLGLSATVGELSAGDDQASVRLTDLAIAPDSAELPPEFQEAIAQLQAGCTTFTAALPEEIPTDLPPELQAAVDTFEGEIEAVLGVDNPLPDNPSVEDLQGLCDAISAEGALLTATVLDVDCQGDNGSVTLTNLTVLGQSIPDAEVPKNTTIVPENPLITVTANRQTTTADGGFSVDGLAVEVAGGEAEVILANATCGETIAAPASDPAPPAAPAPAPVTGTAPVTG